MGRPGLDWFGSGKGQVAGCFEDGNVLSDSTKCRVFLYWLKKCQLHRRNRAENNYWVSVMSTGL